MLTKTLLLINTLKYLKPIQIYYRIYYVLRKKVKGFNYPLSLNSNSIDIEFQNFIYNRESYNNKKFTFLNLSKEFDKIDWNYSDFGKLWTYNLNYFDFLNQKSISKSEGLRLIYDYIDNIENIKDGLEPYPTSLRGINWIKFLSRFNIKDKKIDDTLLAQYYILLDNLEYHLLGNHLLENGFSLLWAGIYFNDDKLLNKAEEILIKELDEQILRDGAHFELSPMYHQIILFRIFNAIKMLNFTKKNLKILLILKNKASLMLTWLENITLKNGDIPLLNDSANRIAPSSKELFKYAKELKIKSKKLNLKDSGYRKINKKNYECIIDVGDIKASYIAGHTHADTFSFIVYKQDKPFIIDTGISTYEVGKTRDYERSTKAHNTIEINNTNSSEVWGGFRVADRASIIDLKEKNNYIVATHDGYLKKYKILHTRKWIFEQEKIILNDYLSKNNSATFRLYFHPNISKKEIKNSIRTDKKININSTFIALEYNKKIKTNMIEISFKEKLKVEILL
jgi:hypothetical protein